MNIILTGHRGLIGSFLKKRLEDEGHKIVLSVDLREGNDVKDLKDYLIEDKVDMFIHCAAFCKINKTITEPPIGFRNAKDTFSVLEFCRKNNINKIMYFSSSRVLSEDKNPSTKSSTYVKSKVLVFGSPNISKSSFFKAFLIKIFINLFVLSKKGP